MDFQNYCYTSDCCSDQEKVKNMVVFLWYAIISVKVSQKQYLGECI